MKPEDIVDRIDACQILGISRQTLLAWIRKGKLRIWKRVGHGSNAALLFTRQDIETLCRQTGRSKPAPIESPVITQVGGN